MLTIEIVAPMNFEKDNAAGYDDSLPAAPPVRARLKWFNVPKGFGFVIPEDREIDAFLHVTTLQRAGIQSVHEGVDFLCHIDYGEKGAHVTHIIGIAGEPAGNTRAPATVSQDRHAAPDAIELWGTLKWYKPEKGFGFVVPDDGLKDVFIHKTCLCRNGLGTLAPGQRLLMIVRGVPKGREVVEFSLLAPPSEQGA